MIRLVDACVAGDLAAAKEAQRTVAPLARLIYNFGEPGCSAHQRMKVALWLMGKISSPVFRRPTRPLKPEQVDRIRRDLNAIGCATVERNSLLPSSGAGGATPPAKSFGQPVIAA